MTAWQRSLINSGARVVLGRPDDNQQLHYHGTSSIIIVEKVLAPTVSSYIGRDVYKTRIYRLQAYVI